MKKFAGVLIGFILLVESDVCAQLVQKDLAFASFETADLFIPVHSDGGAGSGEIAFFWKTGRPAKTVLGYTKQLRPVEAYYFPGTSNKNALVIGGMHGSERSSVEVARRIIEMLSEGEKPYYNVIIIPSLFPDNAEAAAKKAVSNFGRYSNEQAADPNRQMPALGKPFDVAAPVDIFGRIIEAENRLLLRLIQEYHPSRIVNLHAIKDVTKGGVYADPRTDCKSTALGFESDSSLAIAMAKLVHNAGGRVPGNHLETKPTVVYYNDPEISPAGFLQRRNLHGSSLSNNRGFGVSLGGWATTAVCDEKNNREAIRLVTMEFPGYKPSSDYLIQKDRTACEWNVQLFALAVRKFFLEAYWVESF